MIVEKDGVKYYVVEGEHEPDKFDIDGGVYQFFDEDFDEEDEKFEEKELFRLRKVLGGLKNKESKMLYVYRANDYTMSEKARKEARKKMERTKAWRGLQYDLDYVRKEIESIEEYLKRGE